MKGIIRNKSKGITLIALVVTIIVLLILAGITITLSLGDNKLVSKSQLEAEKAKINEYRTVLDLIQSGLETDKILEDLTKEEFLTRYEKKVKKEKANTILKESQITGPEEGMSDKVRVVTKEGYVFDITEEEVRYRGNGENIPDIRDLQIGDIEVHAQPSELTNQNVKVTITLKNPDPSYTLQYAKKNKNEKPSESDWQDYTNGKEIEFTQNGLIFARLLNALKEPGTPATGEIKNIDKLPPVTFTPTSKATTNSITIEGHTTDAPADGGNASSGIEKYYFKNITGEEENEEKIKESEGWVGEKIANGENNVSYSFTELTQEKEYTFVMKAVDKVGNETISKPVKISTEKVPGAVRDSDITFSSNPATWTKDKVIVTITKTNTKPEYTLQYLKKGVDSKPVEGDNWTDCASGKTVEFTENGNLYVRLVDSTHQVGTVYATHNVRNIDTEGPKSSGEITSANTTATSIQPKITVTDNASGIGKVKWQYKKENESTYTDAETKEYETDKSKTGQKNQELIGTAIPNLDPATNYEIKAIIWDVAGNETEKTKQYIKTLEQKVTSIVLQDTLELLRKTSDVNDTITATVEPSNATNKGVTWTIENVSPDGAIKIKDNGDNTVKVYGVKAGTTTDKATKATATIKATAKDGSGVSSVCKVTVMQSYVGYYADLDGNGKIEQDKDGIIYADLAVGNTNGTWWDVTRYGIEDEGDRYEIPKETNLSNLREYIEIPGEEHQETGFLNLPILQVASGGGKKKRFYVMSLMDFEGRAIDGTSTTTFCWYYRDPDDLSASLTSNNFGQGKSNTDKIMEYWDGTKDLHDKNPTYRDIWGEIKTKFDNGWFVPSGAEWCAYGQELGIKWSNYKDKNLNMEYWASNLYYDGWGVVADFESGLGSMNVTGRYHVRLSTTF